jgi:hypothetical protein
VYKWYCVQCCMQLCNAFLRQPRLYKQLSITFYCITCLVRFRFGCAPETRILVPGSNYTLNHSAYSYISGHLLCWQTYFVACNDTFQFILGMYQMFKDDRNSYINSLYLCCSNVIICVVWLLFVLFYVVFVCKCVLPLGDNPTAVNKYIIS